MKKILFVILTITLFTDCARKNYPTANVTPQTDTVYIYVPQTVPATNRTNNLFSSYVKLPNAEDEHFQNTFNEIREMLIGLRKLDFKRAVFISENAYFNDSLDYSEFSKEISLLTNLCILWAEANRKHLQYEQEDFENVLKNWSIFTLVTDTLWLTDSTPISLPYAYDFDDIWGNNDWSKMFVTKLLKTHSGNCHSLPYLYKILAIELGANAHLAFAPNHIYVKHKNKKVGMYNTELTSGEFPMDAWIACSGYISTEAIINKIYMDTLSLENSVAYCLVDLAKGYEKKFGKRDGEFILKCVNLALKYYPNSINTMLLKAETQKHQIEILMKIYDIKNPQKAKQIPEIASLFKEMEKTYAQIVMSGYTEMPKQMYLDWLASIQTAKEEYTNRRISNIFNPVKPQKNE